MAVKLSPVFNDDQLINGIPASGGLLFTYAAGSSTKLNTYTDSTGTTAQSNPIVLNARGEPASAIWLTTGLSYKFVFAASTDTDPPASPIRIIDDVTGVNDSSVSIDQWVASNITPTYITATSFTLPGDQTSNFHIGRRIKTNNTAGTIYSTITNSVFGVLTTVTVVNDNGVLDTGLNSVSYGLLTNIDNSIPAIVKAPFIDSTPLLKGSADATKTVSFEVDGLTTGTNRTLTVQNASGTLAYVDSQTFTGTPTLPTGTIATTQTGRDNSTKLATTAYVDRRFTSSAQTVTSASLLTLAHGLGAKPYRIFITAICTTIDAGYAVGDEIFIAPTPIGTAGGNYGLTTYIDATNVYIRMSSNANVLLANNKTTGAIATLTNGSWQLYVRAEL